VKPLALTPPSVDVDADLAWLLRAAFSGEFAETEARPSDSKRALRLARDTELSGRIGKRLQGKGSSPELAELVHELEADYYTNVAREALAGQALDRIVELSARSGVPVIALKFAGLRRAGIVASGTRTFCDLDLLVPKAEARAFWRALLHVGFSRTGTSEYPHQLEPLVNAYGAVVDLHIHLPGVFVEKRGFASADQLIECGLVSRASGSVLVPNTELLAAHAIAHALLQNRSTPQSYSPLRMVSDVMDLRRVEPEVASMAANYLVPELGATCAALERLCAALSQGIFGGAGFDGTSEQTLLWHCVAARTDFEYSERLRAAGLTSKLRDGSSALEIARYVAHLLYPGELELEALYGPAPGGFARMRRRLWRPVDLTVNAAQRWARARSR
jgi:hypothetical protein